MMNKQEKLLTNPRYVAIAIIEAVEKGSSLSELIPSMLSALSENDKRLTQYIVYGALRKYEALQEMLAQLLKKPIKPSEKHVEIALILAVFEITEMQTANYAAVNNWVSLIKAMDKLWASGLMNAVLRGILRNGAPNVSKEAGKLCLPNWLVSTLTQAWGKVNLSLMSQYFLAHPSMTLRVNIQKISRENYLLKLQSNEIKAVPHHVLPNAIVLEQAINVQSLPGFFEGEVSIQDASAQLAAHFLSVKLDDLVLDACAAPGGKTIAILENSPTLRKLIAVESVESRVIKIKENLERCCDLATQSKVSLVCDSMETYKSDEQFDAILLDVPCSATGIIHRHPDLKLLRKPTDIKKLVMTQREILNHAWTLLKPKGRLLYATCSILPEENVKQMETFFNAHEDAVALPLSTPLGLSQKYGVQILPIAQEIHQKADGFYYCLIEKK